MGRRVGAPGFVSDSDEANVDLDTYPPVPGRHRELVVNADVRTPLPPGQGAQRQIRGRLCSRLPVEGSVTALPAATCRVSLQGAAGSDGRGSGLLAKLAPRSRPGMRLSHEAERASRRQEMPSRRVRLRIGGTATEPPGPGPDYGGLATPPERWCTQPWRVGLCSVAVETRPESS